jgi:hypothetical protein
MFGAGLSTSPKTPTTGLLPNVSKDRSKAPLDKPAEERTLVHDADELVAGLVAGDVGLAPLQPAHEVRLHDERAREQQGTGNICHTVWC